MFSRPQRMEANAAGFFVDMRANNGIAGSMSKKPAKTKAKKKFDAWAYGLCHARGTTPAEARAACARKLRQVAVKLVTGKARLRQPFPVRKRK